MPAFSCMFRHHLTSFKSLKSRLSSRYYSFRHLVSGRRGLDSVPSDSRSGDACLTPSSLDSGQKLRKQPKSLPALHSQLGQLHTLRTYIRGGNKSENLEEGIHVRRDIEQGWQRQSTVTEEKAWGLQCARRWQAALGKQTSKIHVRIQLWHLIRTRLYFFPSILLLLFCLVPFFFPIKDVALYHRTPLGHTPGVKYFLSLEKN